MESDRNWVRDGERDWPVACSFCLSSVSFLLVGRKIGRLGGEDGTGDGHTCQCCGLDTIFYGGDTVWYRCCWRREGFDIS